MTTTKIKFFSIASFLIFSLFVFVILHEYVSTKHHNALDSSVLQTQKYIKNSVNMLINQKKRIYINRAERLFSNEFIIDALKNKDREKFYKLIKPYFYNIKAVDSNFWGMHIILKDNLSFIRVHKPKAKDNLIEKGKKPLIDKANRTKKLVSGFDDGKFGYFLRIVYPVFTKQKEFLGVAEFSINIDSLTEHIKQTLNYESLFLIDNINNKKFLNDLSKTKNGLVIFKATSDELFKRFKGIDKKKKVADHVHNEVIYVNDEILKIAQMKLSDTAHLVIAYNITDTINDQDSFDNNMHILIIFLIVMALVIWFLATKYYLSYFNLQENIKKELEEKVEEKTLKLQQNIIELEDATKSKSEFLANMSHEIRTPLNAINGFIEILKGNIKDQENKKHLEIIDNASQNLLRIIEDILDFSKIESGKLNIDKIFFDPKEEFETLTYLFYAKCSQKNITLNLIWENHLPNSIKTDPLRVKQIISNLISNSIKFTPEGKTIWLKVGVMNNNLHISVKDEGKGIAKNKLEHIFEAFAQEESSTTRNFGGTGLGLSISNELVKYLGGELKVKSELGMGSEFYFSVPVEISDAKSTNNKKLLELKFHQQKILLVEDNKSNQMLMKIVLKKLNLTVDIANDGVEAVSMYQKNKYDAILMDENMPNMNGLAATKEILEYESQNNLKHTPIIALTANALKGDRERFIEAGMDEYLTKPVDQARLSEMLNLFFSV